MMLQEIFQRLLERSPDANKYDFGHVLVIGGSPGMVGAPLLAAEAALRSGAGLVTIASHAEVIDKLEKRVEEIMTLRLAAGLPAAAEDVVSFVQERKVSAVIIGPGQAADFAALITVLLPQLAIPLIIDAGAIAALHDNLDLLKRAADKNQAIILTPHAGEYKKLTGNQLPDSEAEIKYTAAEFAQKFHVTLVLKGHRTLVAYPDRQVYQNTTGNPGLATAGTGDVLSGIIAGLSGQIKDTADAVKAAVYLHGLAGDLAAEAKTEPGMIATDVIDRIPAALRLAAHSPGPS
ncbi:MAG TPA: NAD(P)H-hydrate dehydratase [Candidatus Saccharimonadales bacterium]